MTSSYQDTKGDRKEVKNLFPVLENFLDKTYINEIMIKNDTLYSRTKLCNSSKITSYEYSIS